MRNGTGFTLEPLGELLFGNLDGDDAIEPGVARAIHLSHATSAEGGDDLVRAEAGTGSESHTRAVDYTGAVAARFGLLCTAAGARLSPLDRGSSTRRRG